MKAVILCAGKGTRISSFFNGPKCLIPINGTPLLVHNIRLLEKCSVTEAIIVSSQGMLPLLKQTVEQYGTTIPVRHAVQRIRLGTAHGLSKAEPFLGREPFFYLVGDNFTGFALSLLMKARRKEDADAVIALKAVADPSRFGSAEVRGRTVLRLAEKSSRPPSNLSFTSMAVFRPSIFDAIRATPKNPRAGEYFLTDSINVLIAGGGKVIYVPVTTWRLNINTPQEYETAERFARRLKKTGKR